MREGVLVAAVAAGAPAERAGVIAGERLVAINGKPVRDVLEYYFRQAAARLEMELESADGRRRRVRVRKDGDEDAGLQLAPTADLACKEQCVFCFVHQNPKGLRRTLYFKDDDYRLSFLHGNFVTLTHAPPGALERIIEQRLSPLYVSVHAVEPELRGRLLGNKGPAPILPFLDRLERGGITFYGQIVVCPGLNDGAVLRETVEALAAYHPACPSVAVVPLGLTDHRRKLPSLRPFGADDAHAALAVLGPLQERLRARLGTSFAFAADEIYLRAGVPMPAREHYEDGALREDGVGMWRAFVDGFEARLPRVRKAAVPRRVALVTGALFAPTLAALAPRLARRSGCEVQVVAAENLLFGKSITVAGLLAGRCLIAALRSAPPFDLALVPGETLAEGAQPASSYREHGVTPPEGAVTLDDMTLSGIESEVGRPVRSGGRTADELFSLWPRLIEAAATTHLRR